MSSTRLARREFLFLAATTACLGLPRFSFGAKSADARKEFFASGAIPKLSLTISPEDIESLRKDPRKYVPAKVEEDGKTQYKDVGVHLKGSAGSFRQVDEKIGITLNVDKFEDAQRFHGMSKFHLNNSVQDPTYLTDLLCSELFRTAGVPASQFTHAIVSLNGKSLGFYALKEGLDKGFLKSHFGGNQGNFYDGGFLRDLDQELELVSGKDDVANHADQKALWAAVQEADLKQRFEKLEKCLNVENFVSYLAMEVVVWDWDGYPMNRNNYRMYHEPKSDKFTFMPSGMDQMWGEPGGPLFPEFKGAVARAFVETPQGRERYLARMKSILSDVYHPDALLKRLDELEARVKPALSSVDENAGKDYTNQVNRLRSAIPARAKSLSEQLEKAKA